MGDRGSALSLEPEEEYPGGTPDGTEAILEEVGAHGRRDCNYDLETIGVLNPVQGREEEGSAGDQQRAGWTDKCRRWKPEENCVDRKRRPLQKQRSRRTSWRKEKRKGRPRSWKKVAHSGTGCSLNGTLGGGTLK
ncbi:hypothetical protein NDU88_003907 [Pleurodeles waltl]|uniref:Uncharacterized protein n=1 Tax=Pleurodeles waltl TaxID=8319 RepID=A0AAV7M7N5_PLEWA|nr:hypothetical protein NDU88_003907 [Pleurodeles waltl]